MKQIHDDEVERRLGRARVYIISFGKKAADAKKAFEALSAPVIENVSDSGASDNKKRRGRSRRSEPHGSIKPCQVAALAPEQKGNLPH